jgi:hypothetical protein
MDRSQQTYATSSIMFSTVTANDERIKPNWTARFYSGALDNINAME